MRVDTTKILTTEEIKTVVAYLKSKGGTSITVRRSSFSGLPAAVV